MIVRSRSTWRIFVGPAVSTISASELAGTDRARARHHRQARDALGAVDIGLRPRQHQVVALGIDGHLIDLEPVVVGLDGGAEFSRGDPVVAELDGIGKEAHLGRSELEPGLGAELVSLVEGERLSDEAGRLERDAEHGFEVRTGDIDVDLAPTADSRDRTARPGS